MKIQQSKLEQILFEEVLSVFNERTEDEVWVKIENVFDSHIKKNPKLKRNFKYIAAQWGRSGITGKSKRKKILQVGPIVNKAMNKLHNLMPEIMDLTGVRAETKKAVTSVLRLAATAVHRGYSITRSPTYTSRGRTEKATYETVWQLPSVVGNDYKLKEHQKIVISVGTDQMKPLKGWRQKILNMYLPAGWDHRCIELCLKLSNYTYYNIIGGGKRPVKENDLSVIVTRLLLWRVETAVNRGIAGTGVGDALKLRTYLNGHGKADLTDAMEYVKNMPDTPTHKNISEIVTKLTYVAGRAPTRTAYKKALDKLTKIFKAVAALK